MLEGLQNKYYGDFNFFSLVTRRNWFWQNLILISLLTSFAACLLLLFDGFAKRHGFHWGYFSSATLFFVTAGIMGKLFHAQTIKRHFPHLYISRLDWCKKGLDLEMKRNFEKHMKAKRAQGKNGNLSGQQCQGEIKKRREKGEKIYDNFESLCLEIIDNGLDVLKRGYPTKILWVIVLLLLAKGFFWCFRYCWMDLYENVFTDIGSIKKFQ